MSDLRHLALSLFQTGCAAADPAEAVRRALIRTPLPPLRDGRHILIAFGKAAMTMMSEAQTHLPVGAKSRAIAITNPENARPLPGVETFAASHPLPDETGLAAAQAVMELLAETTENDHILCLISGGGSALLPAPRDGLSLADKIETNRLLLAHGFDIRETNLVRQHLSKLKGGGLAQLAAPSTLRSLIISDVIGDNPSTIASGPTAAPIGSAAEAIATLKSRGVWPLLPPAVRRVLTETRPAPILPPVTNTIIGSNSQSLESIRSAAPDWSPEILSRALDGPVDQAAETLFQAARSAPVGPKLLIWGGETTVKVTGNGLGGRNQELALRFAAKASALPRDWLFLSGGTDGRDGPTDAAGGITDPGTIGRIEKSGDPAKFLAKNDSYHALKASGDLLITGPTGTNVADIQLFFLP